MRQSASLTTRQDIYNRTMAYDKIYTKAKTQFMRLRIILIEN